MVNCLRVAPSGISCFECTFLGENCHQIGCNFLGSGAGCVASCKSFNRKCDASAGACTLQSDMLRLSWCTSLPYRVHLHMTKASFQSLHGVLNTEPDGQPLD